MEQWGYEAMNRRLSTVEIVHACLKVCVPNIRSASVSYYTACISKTYMYRYKYSYKYRYRWTSQVVLVVKNPPTKAGDVRDTGSIPVLGRCPREGHGNPLQYSCLENSMNRGAWWATVHSITESDMTEVT